MIDRTILTNLIELGRIHGDSPIYKFLEILLTLQEFTPEEQDIALEILDKLYVAYKTMGTYYAYATDLVGVDKLIQIADKKVALFVPEQSKVNVLNKLVELNYVAYSENNKELCYIKENAFPLVSPHYLRDTLFVTSEYLNDFMQQIALYMRAFPIIVDEAVLASTSDDAIADSEFFGGGITMGDIREISNNARYFEELNATKDTVEIKKFKSNSAK